MLSELQEGLTRKIWVAYEMGVDIFWVSNITFRLHTFPYVTFSRFFGQPPPYFLNGP